MATQKRFIAKNGLDNNSNTITNVADPSGLQDVATKNYVSSNFVGASSSAYPTVQPTLNLDFANSKTVDPRITFVRNSTAAYYDGQTTALAEQNLLLQSQFVASWTTTNSTLTSNIAVAPDGTTTAATLIPTTATGIHGITQTAGVIGNQYTYSVYGKSNGYTNLQLYADSSGNFNATFDLTAGTAASTGGATVSIVSVGSGWYRCIATFTQASSTRLNVQGFPTGATANNFGYSFTGDGTSGIYIWGAQLEQRSAVTAYTPTTTAAITNYIPVLMTAPAGVPRLDYNPTTGVALGLLIEESRTNLLTYSSDFSNAVWTKPNATITNAANVAPDGTQTAQKLVENTVNAQHYVVQSPTCTGSTAYSLTIYAKAAERAFISMQINESGGAVIASKVIIDLSTGAVGTITALAGGGLASATATTTLIGNGWYRCKISWVTNSASTLAGIYISTASDATTITYTGNGYSGIYIWGAQLEAGSFATSYIPTVATTITRAADQASMTGTNFSSWYNQAQGSFYTAIDRISTLPNNWVFTVISSITFDLVFGPTTANFRYGVGGSTISTGFYVSAIAATSYTGATSTICVNGGAVISTTSTSIPLNSTSITIGNNSGSANYLSGHIRKLSYYPVALSSSNLVALTS